MKAFDSSAKNCLTKMGLSAWGKWIAADKERALKQSKKNPSEAEQLELQQLTAQLSAAWVEVLKHSANQTARRLKVQTAVEAKLGAPLVDLDKTAKGSLPKLGDLDFSAEANKLACES